MIYLCIYLFIYLLSYWSVRGYTEICSSALSVGVQIGNYSAERDKSCYIESKEKSEKFGEKSSCKFACNIRQEETALSTIFVVIISGN